MVSPQGFIQGAIIIFALYGAYGGISALSSGVKSKWRTGSFRGRGESPGGGGFHPTTPHQGGGMLPAQPPGMQWLIGVYVPPTNVKEAIAYMRNKLTIPYTGEKASFRNKSAYVVQRVNNLHDLLVDIREGNIPGAIVTPSMIDLEQRALILRQIYNSRKRIAKAKLGRHTKFNKRIERVAGELEQATGTVPAQRMPPQEVPREHPDQEEIAA